MRAEPLVWLAAVLTAAALACNTNEPTKADASSATSAAQPPTPAAASGSASAAPAPDAREPRTPNELLARGAPTFVVGTSGDDLTDKKLRAQAELVRSMLFPAAPLIEDTKIDVAAGPAGWPKNPVVYGGPHVNAALAAISRQLPFEMKAGLLKLGRDTMSSDTFVLITVVPGRAADADGPGYPTFLLYAGTGTPGVAEINGLKHGSDGFLVGDAFGAFMRGDWAPDGPTGKVRPLLRVSQEREDLEHNDPVTLELRTKPGKPAGKVRVWSIRAQPNADDAPHRSAVLRGLESAAKKLGVEDLPDIDVFLYPSGELKAKLTGFAGDGHAVPYARALHMVKAPPGPDGPLEHLAAHEGTHILTHGAWGPPGTPLLGEGVAVWVSGHYGGKPLASFANKEKAPPIRALLGPDFRRLPEGETYPRAGLFVGAAVREIGLPKVREHLFGATAATWDAACAAAGTTPEKLEAASTASR
ncbi:MAG: hypothetical protein JNL21_38560 [Myxococcales bacterium]|nr:hypothetical protein [Myxococcales bacterium]